MIKWLSGSSLAIPISREVPDWLKSSFRLRDWINKIIIIIIGKTATCAVPPPSLNVMAKCMLGVHCHKFHEAAINRAEHPH